VIYLKMISAVLMASSCAAVSSGSAVAANQWLHRHGCKTIKCDILVQIERTTQHTSPKDI
jgi:uncharacterized OsmC-like protein